MRVRLFRGAWMCLFANEPRAAQLLQGEVGAETLDGPIAFASGILQAFAIEDSDDAAGVFNQTSAFQNSGGNRDRRTSGA